MITQQPKQVNLRDGIYDLEEYLIDIEFYGNYVPDVYVEALTLLKRCYDALIKLTDEHWNELDLDFEFIL